MEKEKLSFKEGNGIDIIKEKKKDIYKIVVYFVSPRFMLDNIKKIVILRENIQINKLNQFIFFLNNIQEVPYFEPYHQISQINFNYVYNLRELKNKIIDFNTNKKDILYIKYIKFVENELFYKFLIDKYLYLFNKSIYSKQKNFRTMSYYFRK